MTDFLLKIDNVAVRFTPGKYLFRDIGFSLRPSGSLAIGGPNGSGKSTLLRVVMGLMRPARGNVQMELGGKKVPAAGIRSHCSIVAPYIKLYEEFTAMEHLGYICSFRGMDFDPAAAELILKRLTIYKKRNHYIKTYSSGMKQRLQYAIALITSPPIAIFDEPFTNLDSSGIEIVKDIITEFTANGHGIIIASNDEREKSLCSAGIELANKKEEINGK